MVRHPAKLFEHLEEFWSLRTFPCLSQQLKIWPEGANEKFYSRTSTAEAALLRLLLRKPSLKGFGVMCASTRATSNFFGTLVTQKSSESTHSELYTGQLSTEPLRTADKSSPSPTMPSKQQKHTLEFLMF